MRFDEAKGYSAATKGLHWLVALIVMGLIPVGVVMANLEEGPLQDRLFVLHESFGVTVLALMLLRVANRLRGAPPPLPSLTAAERIAAGATQFMLYLLLLATPIMGWLALSAYGLGPSFFGLGQLPALLAKDEPLSKILFNLHKAGGLSIAGLVVLHVAGVIRHEVWKKDPILWRITSEKWRRSR